MDVTGVTGVQKFPGVPPSIIPSFSFVVTPVTPVTTEKVRKEQVDALGTD